MTPKEDLDRRLERYLDAQDAAERNGATIGAVKESLQHVVDWTQAHERKDDNRHDESSKRLEALEKSNVAIVLRLDKMDSDFRELKGATRASMDSIHDLTEQDLEEKLAEAKAKHKETMSRVWQVVFWVGTTLAAGGIGAAITKALGH